MAASKKDGKAYKLGEIIVKRQEQGSTAHAGSHIELKEQGVVLMARVRAHGHLVAVLKGLPLSPSGLKKQRNELAAETACTLLHSFQGYMRHIKTPATAIDSLLRRSDLDPEAKQIVRAMKRLFTEFGAASQANHKAKK